MSKLEQEFNENMEVWREHCIKTAYSSIIQDYLNCEGYRNIVYMGKKALPLLRKAYDTESDDRGHRDSLRWLLVNPVKAILGADFQIPNWMRGMIPVMAKYTAKWLDENMEKYVK